MGKKLDALLGRGFKTSKFRPTAALAISRVAVLKNQRQARCSIARSDVVELLKGSHHERALLRVEQVMKEQNMLDVLVVLEGYCHLLVERISLIEQDKVCPDELGEAVASLIFASTRCGEFPELQEIRAIFTSRYGKEFAARAVELRNNCGVNPKIIQKLSTRMPSLESKLKVLREIAADNNIDLSLDETFSDMIMENHDSGQGQKPGPSSEPGVSSNQWGDRPLQPEEMEQGEDFSDSVKTRRQYRDVADAAQAAFESAAYAAAAARAAVELSRSESTDPDDPRSPNLRPRKVLAINDPMKTGGENSQFAEAAKGMGWPNESGTKFKGSDSTSSSDSLDAHDNVEGHRMLSDVEDRNNKKGAAFDESDGEDEQKSWVPGTYNSDADYRSDSRAQVGLKMGSAPGNSAAQNAAERKDQNIEPLDLNRRPISVRNRHGRGW